MAFASLFLASFLWVFLQGFQSRSVNSGEYVWAFFGSFLLGTAQVFVLSTVIKAESPLHTFVYCLGGSVGIVTAMRVHRYLKDRKETTMDNGG